MFSLPVRSNQTVPPPPKQEWAHVCMAIKHIIVLFVETPRKFITAIKLSIRKPGSSSVLIITYYPGLRIESFAVINLRCVSTNKTIITEVL